MAVASADAVVELPERDRRGLAPAAGTLARGERTAPPLTEESVLEPQHDSRSSCRGDR
jgi:hypothetical protein